MSRRHLLLMVAVVAASLSACADDEADDEGSRSTMTTIDRPDGPAAELTKLTGGKGINLVAIRPVDLEAVGYEEEEYAAAGTATSYVAVGDLPADGTYELAPDASDDYVTRIVVRRPADPADFNGTVLVEWLNITGGIDANPDWTYGEDEIVRGGYAWVGVSTQAAGVQGGDVAMAVEGAPEGGIKAADPERYGQLSHPGDAFSYDVYTQVARALRANGGARPLGDLVPERLLAMGQSQSAFRLTTYVNGVQPLTKAFDGFLVHSRSGGAADVGDGGLMSALTGPPVLIRTDGEAPVLVVENEGDVLGVISYFRARQPDATRFRLWEVAGTAHADAFLLGANVERFDCNGQVNDGPQRFVVRSAIRHLDRWVRTGDAPPEAPRLEIDESADAPTFVRDADGNVEGGIRTPPLDVPVAVLSGEPIEGSAILCTLFGRTVPFTGARLRELYPSVEDYRGAYAAAVDEAIEAGWVLDEDRDDLMRMAAAIVG